MDKIADRGAGARKGRGHKRAKPDVRTQRRGERRDAILAAALEEFAARGFAAARLDDVARRAGVAKGTIYLYFRDKESLFQELVRTMLSPLVGVIEAAPAAVVRMDAPSSEMPRARRVDSTSRSSMSSK